MALKLRKSTEEIWLERLAAALKSVIVLGIWVLGWAMMGRRAEPRVLAAVTPIAAWLVWQLVCRFLTSDGFQVRFLLDDKTLREVYDIAFTCITALNIVIFLAMLLG